MPHGGGPFLCFCKCAHITLQETDLTDPISKRLDRVIRRRTGA